SSWRKLFTQFDFCAFNRASSQLGTAMVARRPIKETTIMISTRVKPAVLEGLIFIAVFRDRFTCRVFIGNPGESMKVNQGFHRGTAQWTTRCTYSQKQLRASMVPVNKRDFKVFDK